MARSHLKLLFALCGVVALVVAIVAVDARRALRDHERERTFLSLSARADLVRDRLGTRPLTFEDRDALDALADELAATAEARVTLIAADGTVVGDSAVPSARLGEFENHGGRPEVVEARESGTGRAVRSSVSVARELAYVATRSLSPSGGFVRLAEAPTTPPPVGGFVARAAGIGLLAALGLAALLSWLSNRDLGRMRSVAASVAGGDLSQRVRRHSGDELDDIAGAIDQMAEQLRLRLEEATHEKERLQAVLNGMVEGVLVVDTGGKVVLANDRVREFFDVNGPVQGRGVLEAIRHAELDDMLNEAAETDVPVSRELQFGATGERFLRIHAVRFPAGGGRRMGTVAVLHDMTDLARLEQIRRDFVANASHELRTPLAAISGFAETLLDSRSLSDDDQRSYLQVIERHAHRLTAIVSDLLELSRIESRKVALEPEPLDVAALAERTIEDLHDRFQEKDLMASVRRSGGSPRARADARSLEQILLNLLDNAIKYSGPGGTVSVAIEESGRDVVVTVQDTGIGIPEEDRERIFERFYRVDKARSRELGGTGLGLSIVKHLVQSQGGEITVESEAGAGSEFRFTLPLDSTALPT